MTNRRGPQPAACTDTGDGGTPPARPGERNKSKSSSLPCHPPRSKDLAQRILLRRIGAIAIYQLVPLPGPAELAYRGGDRVPGRRHELSAQHFIRLLERTLQLDVLEGLGPTPLLRAPALGLGHCRVVITAHRL